MAAAIDRYNRVVARERNLIAYYFLSMAHLNAGHWEEGLNLFHKMANLAPERKVFAYQLRRLLEHMASREPESAVRIEALSPWETLDTENQRKRILVVEDSPTTRKVIAITLGQQGYEIIEARDGFEALSKLNDRRPHLILLDLVLPRIDGYAILDIIKKHDQFRHVPVILLTAKDGVLSRWKGRRAGSTAYLTKPFDPKKLVATVEKHI
jgi:twitching motility two-component system response regulator PilG